LKQVTLFLLIYLLLITSFYTHRSIKIWFKT
jgi:hypothetical protein